MSPTENSRVPVCKYYLQNNCARGSTCLYSHQQDPTIALSVTSPKTVCIHYQKGSCRFGGQCRQLHQALAQGSVANTGNTPELRSASSHFPLNASRNLDHPQSHAAYPPNHFAFGPCKFFAQGNCAKGTACPFPHIISDPKASMNQSVLPFKGPQYSSGITMSKTSGVNLHSQPGAPKLPCKFFNRGECMKGAGCQFLHISAEPLPSLAQSVLRSNLHEINNPPFSTLATNPSTNVQQPDNSDHRSEHASEPDRDTDTVGPEAATTERLIFSCKVQFGSGASIRGITTPFDSRHIVLSNLPRKVTQDELIILAEPFGALSSVVLEKSSTLVPPSARIQYAECAEAARAVDNLDNKEFQSTTLAARLDLRAVESGVGILLSRKVKISWYAPSTIAWAHYPTISSARDHMKKLEGKAFDGHCISVSFQTPGFRQTRSFSIEIKGLPVDVNPSRLKRFCGSSSVMLGSPSYSRETGIQKVREQLGTLDSFDVLPADKMKKKITAFAQFSSAESAAAAVKNLDGVAQPFLSRSPLWLEQVHSVKYNIPARQFATLMDAVDRFRDAHQNACKMRYYHRDENGAPVDPVCLRIYGPDPRALGHMKIGLENLIQGELFVSDGKEVWDEYFDTSEGEEFLQTINSDPNIFVKLDSRTRNFRIFGAELNRVNAKGLMTRFLANIHAKRHTLPLERDVLRALLTGGLKALHDSMGAEKILLDVVARMLIVRGSPDEVNTVRRAVAAMHTSLPLVGMLHSLAVCPVCFCEATDPIELTCGHIYCTPCLQHFLRSAAGPNFSLLRCVAEGPASESRKTSCAKHIPYPIIRLLLSSTEETQLLEASFLAYIHSRPAEFHYCPTPDCKVVYRPTKEDTALQCSACLNRVCGACHVEFHEGLTCAEHRDNLQGGHDAFRRWREENGVKPCPKCHADLEKAGGCNHMMCIRCRTHICWVCMDTFSEEDSSGGVYQHMRQKHGGFYD